MLAVLDTNVLVSGLRSALGASNAVLRRLALGDYRIAVSTALCLEYEDVLNRPGLLPTYTPFQITSFLDSICAVADEAYIYYRWRPFLPDPKDDLVFECALAAGATHIITHNGKDFRGADILGISAVTPDQFLSMLPTP
ncbi:MAG TPA: PIN domain-containing protein [Prosthecobacter sp.]